MHSFRIGLIVLMIGLLGFPIAIDDNDENIEFDAFRKIVKRYGEIKKAEQSELKPFWIEIINKRIQCYSSTLDYRLRLQNCRKEYMYEILITAREETKSTPSLGEFMWCVRDCPLAFSLCKGEEYLEYSGIECVEVESLCIEKCLDDYWRGRYLDEW